MVYKDILYRISSLTSKNISKSIELISRFGEYIVDAAILNYYPMVLSYARGSRVKDVDGNEYIDFLSSASIFNVGHGNEYILSALRKQMDKLVHYINTYFYTEPPLVLAWKLTEITPGRFRKRVFFALSGSEAMDFSIKCVKSATKRSILISFYGSFHGTTYASTAISPVASSMRRGLEPLVPSVYYSYFPDCLRCPMKQHYPECGIACFSTLEHLLQYVVDPDNVAGVFLEPIQGDAGVIVPPREYIVKLRSLCSEYNIPLIVDEIQTGLGRVGYWFAVNYFNIEPDLIVLGKSLGGGLPLSAIIGRAEIMDRWEGYAEMTSMAGHTLSCVAALANIEYIERNNLVEEAKRKGEYLRKRLLELKDKHDIVGDIRGLGLLYGVDIVKDKYSLNPDRKAALKIVWRAWELGLLTMTIGKYGNVIRIIPPLTITLEDLDRGVDILDQAIADVVKGRVDDRVLEFMRGW